MRVHKKEVVRQLVHLSGILFVIVPWGISYRTIGALLLLAAAGSFVYSEFALRRERLAVYLPWPLNRFESFIHRTIKERERDGRMLKGVITFATGIGLAMIIFTPSVATLAVIALTVGDSVSTLVGIHFGTRKLPRFVSTHRSWEGTLASFFSILAVAPFYAPLPLALVTALTGTVVEAFDMHVDDNIAIPMVTGLVLTLLQNSHVLV